MNIQVKPSNTVDVKGKVLNCEVKDQSGLNDFQKLPDQDMIAIPKVGINRFRVPLNFIHRNGEIMNHDCHASMYVNLKPGKTGINMSRLCSILQDQGGKQSVDLSFLRNIIDRYRDELRDEKSEDPMGESFYQT